MASLLDGYDTPVGIAGADFMPSCETDQTYGENRSNFLRGPAQDRSLQCVGHDMMDGCCRCFLIGIP